MATRWDTFPVKFEGGLTTNVGRIEQGIQFPGSATILQNFEADIQGGYTRILGYQKYSSTAVTGSGQIFGVISLSASEVLAVRDGKFLYSSGTTWTNKLTLTSPTIVRIDEDVFNFNGTRKTVVVDGVNDPAFFDHTAKTMAYATAPPSDISAAQRVRVFKNHIFFAKGTKLSFTAPYAENDFTAASGAGVINIGDTITGLVVFREQLIVFCANAIYRITGSSISDFTLNPITLNTGCLHGDSVQEVGGDIMYLGPDGVRYLSATERMEDFGLSRASAKIQKDVIDTLGSGTRFSSITLASKNQYRLYTYVSNVVRENSNGFIGVKFSDQTSENISWSLSKGVKVYDASKYQDSNGEYIVFCSDTGYVYRLESGNSFDGEDIEAIFETPYMPVTDPKKRKTFYKHTLYAKPQGVMDVMCTLKFDYAQVGSSQSPTFSISGESGVATYGSSSAVYGTSVYGVIGQEQYYNNTVGSGFVVALRYRSKSQSSVYNINFAVLEFRENERR